MNRSAGKHLAAGAALVSGALLALGAASSAVSQPATGGYATPATQGGSQAQPAAASEQVFHVATVHIDAKTNVNGDATHPPEPFPESAAPSGGGFLVNRPDQQGNWSVRAFVFQPSQLVVRQGDSVVLNFVGVQGPSHSIEVDGQPGRISLKRGEMKTVRFVAGQPGVVRFASIGREPTMRGSILVLRRE